MLAWARGASSVARDFSGEDFAHRRAVDGRVDSRAVLLAGADAAARKGVEGELVDTTLGRRLTLDVAEARGRRALPLHACLDVKFDERLASVRTAAGADADARDVLEHRVIEGVV